jgi:CRP-like cAMP-binding protein
VHGSSELVLFEGLRRQDRKRVDSLGTIVRMSNGRTVMKQGSRNRCFYVLIAGNAVVQRDGVDGHLLGAGDWFGEIGALTPGGEVAASSVVAFCDLEVRVYDPREFASLDAAVPGLHERLVRSMLGSALEFDTVQDGDRRTDAVDPAERAERSQALDDSLA